MRKTFILLLMSIVTLAVMPLAWSDTNVVASTKLLQLQDVLQKNLQREDQLRQQLFDKITALTTMMRDFDDAASSMNGLSGLGRVEQLQFKAERYAAERQVRKQIEKEILGLADTSRDLQDIREKNAELGRLIEAEKKVMEIKASIDVDATGKPKDGKGSLDPRNIEYYTVKKSGDLKQISALPEVYGNAAAWKYLFDANRDKIATPNAIVSAGTTLIVPNIKIDKTFINME